MLLKLPKLSEMIEKGIDYEKLKRPPFGHCFFQDFLNDNFYYVDKTPYIKKIFKDDPYKVLLLARPKRFGKTLTLNTFREFLKINPEDPGDTSVQDALFKDTKIYEDKDFCQEFMGKFPVIKISLFGIDALEFETALALLACKIEDVANDLEYLKQGSMFSAEDRAALSSIQRFHVRDTDECKAILCNSLRTLSNMLYRYYGKQVILIIDEYDVPLYKAYENGYYDEMLPVIRELYSAAFKDNPSIFKVLLVGWLRLSNESIFHDFSNFNTNTVINDTGELAPCFGFTDDEVKAVLSYFGLSQYQDAVKACYGGYRIGNMDIYCPCDVMHFCSYATTSIKYNNESFYPKSFAQSGTIERLIGRYLRHFDKNDADEMQSLFDGGQLEVMLNENLNCDEIGKYHRVNDLWTYLVDTGFLAAIENKQVATKGTVSTIRISNNGAKWLFRSYISAEYTYDRSGKLIVAGDNLLKALVNCDAMNAQKTLDEMLQGFVSVESYKTQWSVGNLYQDLLTRIFDVYQHLRRHDLLTVKEKNGYLEITLYKDNHSIAILLGLKSTGNEDELQNTAVAALKQVEDLQKSDKLLHMYYDEDKIYCYGIAFCHRNCYVQRGE